MDKIKNGVLWGNILRGKYPNDLTKPHVIANRIIEAINDGILQPDSRLLPQREMMKLAGVWKKVIADAISILREEKYIYTKGTKGSFVSNIDKGTMVKKDFHLRRILFCQETILDNSPTVKELSRKLNNAKNHFDHLNSIQRKEPPPKELLSNIQFFLNNAISLPYSLNSIYYAYNHQQALDCICRTFLKKEEVFVTLLPADQKILNMVNIHCGKVEFIYANQLGISIPALENLCKTKKVRLVYIQPHSIIAGTLFSLKKENELLDLQKKYKFIIIVDDVYAGIFKKASNSLLEKANKNNAEIIYIKPLSLLNHELNQIMAIASKPGIIDQLKKILIATGNGQDVVLLKTINEIIENGTIRRAEVKVYKKMQQVISSANKYLHKNDFWNMENFHTKESWFFYLEPISGVFPGNIHELLSKKNIDILNANDYSWHRSSPHGIIISLAAYLDDDRLEEDLNILMITLQELIIIN